MKLEIKLFARVKEIAGAETVELDLPDSAQVGDIRTALAARFPEMSPLVSTLHIAIGTDYADNKTPLTSDAEIACFPPVSGG